MSAKIRKILNPSDNCDEQGVLLYTQSPHQVLKCGDLVFEHLVKQLDNLFQLRSLFSSESASNEHKFGRLYCQFGKFSIKTELFWIKILSWLYLSTDASLSCGLKEEL